MRAQVQRLAGSCEGTNSAADLAGESAHEQFNEFGVDTTPHGCVEVNQLHQRKRREAGDPFVEVVELQCFFPALNQLNDLFFHEINRRDQHGNLTGTPAAKSCCFSSEIECKI